MSRLARILLLATVCAARAAAQDPSLERIPLRVSSTGPGASVEIDRGQIDGVAVGDEVSFQPRDGGTYRGKVTQLAERSAIVELQDPTYVPVLGTRGEIMIPSARRARPESPPQQAQPPQPEPGDQRWQNQDEGWQPGMPLLAQVQPVRPEERGTVVTGRFYSIGDLIYNPPDGGSNTFLRVGTDLLLDNPFGHGGALRANAEFDYRTEVNDQAGLDLLFRRLSYYWGGSRFENTRWEVGRFLQTGMPEFGVLDGVEFGMRRDNWNRFGASIGFMPEPDDDFESLEDLQFAVYYLWVADEHERATLGGGFQKTLHNGKTDRDLLILKGRYLAENGWDLSGRVWIDFYYGRDDIKGTGPEVTQALLSALRRWENGDELSMTYSRVRYPEILRNEFIPVVAQEIADNRYDRITLEGWSRWTRDKRLHGAASGFDDEDGLGGALEGGVEIEGLFVEESRADVTLFVDAAQFSNAYGLRLGYGRALENGRWDVFYELSNRHELDFPDDADDILQNRLRASRSFHTASGFDVSLYGEGRLADDEASGSIGFNVQKSF